MTTETERDESLLVQALVDGELDPANAAAIERRIAADPALAAERDRIVALRRVLSERLPREPLPPHLRMRVERGLGVSRKWPSWRSLAASVVLAAIFWLAKFIATRVYKPVEETAGLSPEVSRRQLLTAAVVAIPPLAMMTSTATALAPRAYSRISAQPTSQAIISPITA